MTGGWLFKIVTSHMRAIRRRAVMQSLAVLLSAFVISFLLLFLVGLAELSAHGAELSVLPFYNFVDELIFSLRLAVIILSLITSVTVFVFCRIDRENELRFRARLSSVGATAWQVRLIRLAESSVLFIIPVILGAILGIAPSIAANQALISSMRLSFSVSVGAMRIFVTVSSLILVMCLWCLFSALFSFGKKKASGIGKLRGHNEAEAESRHSYRNSYTFRNSPVEKRIAKKGVSYYRSAYARISLMLTATFSYPLIAIAIIGKLLSVRFVADSDPFDSVDTTELTFSVMENIGAFLAASFLLLCIVGVLQCVYLMKMQASVRREGLRVYRSVGLTERGALRVVRGELLSATMHALIAVIFFALVIFTFL